MIKSCKRFKSHIFLQFTQREESLHEAMWQTLEPLAPVIMNRGHYVYTAAHLRRQLILVLIANRYKLNLPKIFQILRHITQCHLHVRKVLNDTLNRYTNVLIDAIYTTGIGLLPFTRNSSPRIESFSDNILEIFFFFLSENLPKLHRLKLVKILSIQ